PSYVGHAVRGASGQAANLDEWRAFGGSVLATVSENGYFTTRKNAAPADGELAAGEAAYWFDATAGAAKFCVKAKDANGTGPIGTGSVAVDHNYPTANSLKFQTGGGQGIGGALVRAYLASEYAANPATATIRGQTLTLDSGAWANVIDLDPGAYKVVFKAEG